jgi:alpha-glucosidase
VEPPSTAAWWKHAVLYEIYVRSFQDSSGDGIGDLAGIRERLDYLVRLGVDALWLTPFYPSPMADFGYDVADYTGVDPIFGTLSDFDALLRDAHAQGLRIILDFVPNHTSDAHPWFLDSRSSRASARRDWYLWADPAPDGGPPNNWRSVFGGSAWELDASTGQYYYHAFDRRQPDLNWRNPAVEAAMLDAMRFWLERGVDGFRVDVMWHLIKDAGYRANPLNPQFVTGQASYNELLPVHSTDQPEVHAIVARMRQLLERYGEKLLIGEIYLPVDRLVRYYGENRGAHLPLNFQLIGAPWQPAAIAAIVQSYEAALGAGDWPNWVLGNHDQPRIASRVGSAQARVAAMLLLTLRGTPTLYYGDEIGLENVEVPAELAHDPQAVNMPGLALGRDPYRTPMRWEASATAGFSKVTSWLPVGPGDAPHVHGQERDPASMLALYRRLLLLRRGSPALQRGTYFLIDCGARHLAYGRRDPAGADELCIVLNFTHEPLHWDLPDLPGRRAAVALSTHCDRYGARVDGSVVLRPDEGLVLRTRSSGQ